MGASSSIPKEHRELASDDGMVLISRETSGSKDEHKAHSSKEEVPIPTVPNMDPKPSEVKENDKVQENMVKEDGTIPKQPPTDASSKELDKHEGETVVKEEEKKLLTEEELKERKASLFDDMKERIEKVEALEELYDENGKCDPDVRKALFFMTNLYFKLKDDATLEDIIIFRRECAKLLWETRLLTITCDLFIQTLKIGWTTDEGEIVKNLYSPLSFAALIILNFSDASPELAIKIANFPGLLETLKVYLNDHLEDHLKEIPEKDKVLNWSISIIHNVSMQEANIGRLRELDFTSVLKPYLGSHNEKYKINVLASLAAIVNEKESEIINAHQDSVVFLQKVLRKALNSKDRRHMGWSCKESGLTVRLLARNDANKKLLVELGFLELLVKLGQTGNQEEQYESVSAITHLAFEKENRKKIVDTADLGVVDMLHSMVTSTTDMEVKKMCINALWTLRDELLQSSNKTYQNIGERYGGTGTSNGRAKSASPSKKSRAAAVDEKDLGHIMISYQWADQQLLMRIRDQLKASKHRVWMDIDQMGGSTLQAMADAVENASIILMCMTQKYKDSPNCRAEAEYAFQKQKKIIPLKMQRGYVPDGWLGFICGAKLFFDFGGKYPFEDKMSGLLKEVSVAVMKQKGVPVTEEMKIETITPLHRSSPVPVDTVDYKPVSRAPAVVPMATLNTIRKWQKDDVENWVAKNNLQSSGVENLSGGEIALLMSMRLESPDTFYRYLHDMVRIHDLLTLSKVVWALHDLTE